MYSHHEWNIYEFVTWRCVTGSAITAGNDRSPARAILRDHFYAANVDDHRADANDEHDLVALSLIVRCNPVSNDHQTGPPAALFFVCVRQELDGRWPSAREEP
jgi:hypothetical protein